MAEVAGRRAHARLRRRGRGAATPRPVRAARRRPRTAGRPRVHVGHHRRAQGGAVPRPAAGGGHPHRRRRRVGRSRMPPPTPMLAGTQFAHVGFMTKLPWYLRLRHHHARARPVAGRGRAAPASPSTASPRSAASPRRSRCCCARTSRPTTSTCVQASSSAAPRHRPRSCARPGRASARDYSIRYSSTESGGCGTGTAFDADDEEALFTVGRPRGGIEVGICDDDGGPAPRRRGGRGVAALAHDDGRVLARPGRRPRTRSSDGLAAHRRPRLDRRARAACASPGA